MRMAIVWAAQEDTEDRSKGRRGEMVLGTGLNLSLGSSPAKCKGNKGLPFLESELWHGKGEWALFCSRQEQGYLI